MWTGWRCRRSTAVMPCSVPHRLVRSRPVEAMAFAHGSRPLRQLTDPAGVLPFRRDRQLTSTRLIVLTVIVLIGALIRVYRIRELSLRNDESFTLLYARQPWARVLGLHGFY